MNNLPEDVIINNLYKNDEFAICIDPKHSEESYHYTIWYLQELKNISKITENIIDNLDNFIKIIQGKNIFSGEKMYFTFPPTHNRLHLHIVPKNYISYRPLNEIYLYNKDFKDNINKINKINKKKINANRLDVRFNIGIIIISDINKINVLSEIKEKQQLDYLVCIYKKYETSLNELLNNHKLINEYLISDNLNNYLFFIKYDFFIII
jgi:hypothetical protein